MLNFVNGFQNSVIRIIDNANALIDVIELPYAGREGLKESIEELAVTHDLNNFTILKKVFGYRINWELPYKEYSNINTMMSIKKILDYQKAGYRLILIPRKDLPIRKFEVFYSGKSLDYGINGGGIFAKGNKHVELQFTTKYLINDLIFYDPNAIRYTGWYNHNRLAVYAE